MITKRLLLASFAGLVCVPGARPVRAALPPVEMARHQQFMRLAIAVGAKNPIFPFGAVIVDPATGETMAEGLNNARENPTLHGEIVCINDYVRRHGNKDWESKILYTTCEPCPMCMMALVWARIGGVVFGTSYEGQQRAGFGDPSKLTAKDVLDATPFYKPMLLGGVLQEETDSLFMAHKAERLQLFRDKN
jgi:tRNA(Arg) A34 adenosine deaminase TadA